MHSIHRFKSATGIFLIMSIFCGSVGGGGVLDGQRAAPVPNVGQAPCQAQGPASNCINQLPAVFVKDLNWGIKAVVISVDSIVPGKKPYWWGGLNYVLQYEFSGGQAASRGELEVGSGCDPCLGNSYLLPKGASPALTLRLIHRSTAIMDRGREFSVNIIGNRDHCTISLRSDAVVLAGGESPQKVRREIPLERKYHPADQTELFYEEASFVTGGAAGDLTAGIGVTVRVMDLTQFLTWARESSYDRWLGLMDGVGGNWGSLFLVRWNRYAQEVQKEILPLIIKGFGLAGIVLEEAVPLLSASGKILYDYIDQAVLPATEQVLLENMQTYSSDIRANSIRVPEAGTIPGAVDIGTLQFVWGQVEGGALRTATSSMLNAIREGYAPVGENDATAFVRNLSLQVSRLEDVNRELDRVLLRLDGPDLGRCYTGTGLGLCRPWQDWLSGYLYGYKAFIITERAYLDKLIGSSSRNVQGIINLPPGRPGGIRGTGTGRLGQDYEFAVEPGVDDVDAIDCSEGLTYEWDWGDGIETSSGRSLTARHRWGRRGTYWIRARAVDAGGLRSAWSSPFAVEIKNRPPDKPVISGPVQGVTYRSYTFHAATEDPEGDGMIFLWEWGDGTSYQNIVDVQEHEWAIAGTYSVRVKASDSLGAESAWSEGQVVVIQSNQPPVCSGTPIGPATGISGIGHLYRYSISCTDPDGDSISEYLWDWGDGTSSSCAANSCEHSWLSKGAYDISVRARDRNGLISSPSGRQTVVIDVPRPDLVIAGYRMAANQPLGMPVEFTISVGNLGTAGAIGAGYSALEVYVDGVKRVAGAGQAELAPLAAHDTWEWSGSLTFCAPGPHTIEVVVDPQNVSGDSNWNNNRLALAPYLPRSPEARLLNGEFEQWQSRLEGVGMKTAPAFWCVEGEAFRDSGRTLSSALGLGALSRGGPVSLTSSSASASQYVAVGTGDLMVGFFAKGGGWMQQLGTPASRWAPFVQVTWYDGSGVPIADARSAAIVQSEAWRYYSFRTGRPVRAVFAKIQLIKPGGGAVSFDGVTLSGGPPV